MSTSAEHSLQEHIRFSPLAIVELDTKCNVRLWNPAAERMFGWTETEVIGSPYPVIPSQAWADFENDLLHLFEGSTIQGKYVHRQHKDGRQIDARLWAAPIHNQQNKITGITAILEDITIQKENERQLLASEALRENVVVQLQPSEERMRLALDAARVGFWDWDVVSNKVTWSATSSRHMGLPENSPATFELFMNEIHQDDRNAMQASIESAMAHNTDHVIEYRVVWPDGSLHWRFAKGCVLRDQIGLPVRMVGIVIDIDDCKLADERLLLQATALDAAANSVVITDDKGTILWTNRSFSQITGYEPEEVLGKDCRLLKSGEQDAAFYANMWLTISAGKTWHGELTNRRKDGSLYAEEMTITPVRVGGDEITHFIAIKQDVTSRKLAEDALRQASKQYQLLFDANPLPMWVVDRKTLEFLAVNEAAIRHYGYSRQEFLAMTITDIRPEKDIPALLKAFVSPIQGLQAATTWQHRKKDGTIIDVEVVSHPLDFHGRKGELVASIDVTERKQAENVLRRTEEKYRSIFENAAIGIFQATTESRPVSVNRAMARMLGYESPDQLLAEVANIADQLFVDPSAMKELERVLKTDGVRHDVELEIRCKDGSKKWVSANLRAVAGEDGVVILHEGTIEDITERKRAEEFLLQKVAMQDQLSAIIATVPGVVYTFLMRSDGSCAFPFASSRLEDIFDIAPDTLKQDGTPALARIHSDDLNRVQEAIADSFLRLTPWHGEFRVNHPIRGVIWAEGDSLPECLRDGSVLWHGFIRDVTARKQLEGQLRQAQKLEAIGTLSSGVAHDFNNIMGIVVGYSDLIAEKLTSSDPNLPRIKKIKDAAQRATALTRQLLAFSRQQVLAPVVMDLNEHITQSGKMLARLLGEDIQLILSLAQDLWSVKADPTQVDQVLMNLAVNAREALPHGGKVEIETRNVEVDESHVAAHPESRTGAFVMICIADTGVGMTSEVMQHMFEPFFTTKKRGSGSGLGLSTVYGIVEQSGGFVSFSSKVGSGATFQIFLPRNRELSQVATPQTYRAPKSAASKTILLAEDDADLKEIVSILLQELDYTVLAASNGPEAIRMAEKHAGAIDLLLTDVVMPDMSGRELADRLHRRSPQLKVLYVSGYNDDLVFREGRLAPGTSFLHKPVTKMDLDQKLRGLFEASNEATASPAACRRSGFAEDHRNVPISLGDSARPR